MNSSNPSKRILPRLVVVGALALLAAGGFTLFRQSRQLPIHPSAVPEVLRAELHLRDGRLYHDAESNAFTGWLLERYGSGTLRSRSAVSNGMLHGLSEGWHTNGQLQVTESFGEGISHGVRTKWYANGNKLSEAVIVDGQLHGPFRRWHENGALAEEVEMKDGQSDGIAKAYFPDGSLKSQATLQRGKVVDQKFWKNGESKEEAAEITTTSASSESP